ncbi:hypothetical protein PHJA_000575300 [Phtheirospermum japonicum]|uniref:Agenet domain-containing protein n=1 Tax=Phtheirospermum japonicum TaxID=374723 RepID=A0A830BBB1_9LAMI|nr:hypothetical protein PHJA_000575300 [Phtheirospermum japonicum]
MAAFLPKTTGSVPRFRRGDLVEVASGEEGFVGSYYEATVVEEQPGGDYVVQYKTLFRNDFSGPLMEVAPAAEIRPRPPKVVAAAFRPKDVVDAFDNDGWWVGKITGRVGNKYYVYFESTGDEIAYPKNRVRVHQELVFGPNRKWVCVSSL